MQPTSRPRPLKPPPLPEYPELLVAIYGATVGPTKAARDIARVNFRTIKAHIAAGNIATDPTGKRVDVKSLALYMQTGVPQGKPARKPKPRERR